MKKWIILFFSMALIGGGSITYHISNYRTSEEQIVSASEVRNMSFIPGGMPIGIYMDTNGVLVVGTSPIKGIDHLEHEPAKSIVQEGDYIEAINHTPIETKKELIEVVEDIDQEETMALLTLRRDDELINVRIKPVCVGKKEYKLGIWVRDNVQGLGTVTFVDQNQNFGALGHGIHDPDTDELLDMKGGKLYKTSILDIHKGTKGTPGGLEGVIIYNRYNVIGEIRKNNDSGIYGRLNASMNYVQQEKAIPAASKYDIEEGDATIRCTIDKDVEEYQVEICKINLKEKEVNKGLVIRVTDPKLLKQTGGIIQGMSGSPIIQNGKLIGAVTHVFVQDSTKGYGIFIENMTQNVE